MIWKFPFMTDFSFIERKIRAKKMATSFWSPSINSFVYFSSSNLCTDCNKIQRIFRLPRPVQHALELR